jgi:hypothetical protein
MALGSAAAAAATLLAFALLCAGGYLLAVALLGAERCRRDPLALAVATLVGATAQALLIALALGAGGVLRFDLALPIEALVVGLLWLIRRRTRRTGAGSEAAAGAAAPGRVVWERAVARLREHPFLALLTVHAVASEALRGLLRPPLSWDSLMYHLLLTATWVQDQAISVVYGMFPTSYYGYVPANGSVWLWWWMAPSHSELYVNLAFLPHWLLLGLATGGVARELGARRSWPLAAYLVLLCPTVVRFAATDYVDILLASMLVAAAFFGLVWLRAGGMGSAAVAGLGLGIAAGTKVLGPPYGLALAAALLLVARGAWGARLRQAALALLLASLLGSYFYLRNMAEGAGPLAMTCAGGSARSGHLGAAPILARPQSVLANLGPLLARGTLVDTFLGYTVPSSLELGIGPQAILLLPALALPLLIPAPWRRGAFVVWIQILCQLAIWVTVPEANGGLVFANVRFLIGAIGLAFAALLAAAELHGVGERAERGIVAITAALLIQDLLMLHSSMPREVRLVMAAADLIAVLLVFSPPPIAGLRRRLADLGGRRVAVGAAAAALALAVLGAPWLARFRAADRTRALATEYTAHDTLARNFARAWGWLDRYGDAGTVAVAINPGNYFVYPAMGMRLQRRAVYANVNRRDSRRAIDYPGCFPRVDGDAEAWLENLDKLGVRWVHLGHLETLPFPIEAQWAKARPDRFTVRYADPYSLIYELTPRPEA